MNDAQLSDILCDPAIGLVEVGDAFAGLRVLVVPQPVPDSPSDVEFVVEDTRAACNVAVNRRGVPLAATGTRTILPVQIDGDPAWGFAGSKFGEDAAHDSSLGRIDRAAAADRITACVAL